MQEYKDFETLPAIIVSNNITYPNITSTFELNTGLVRMELQKAIDSDTRQILIVLDKKNTPRLFDVNGTAEVGMVAVLKQTTHLSKFGTSVVVQGLCRAKIIELKRRDNVLTADFIRLDDEDQLDFRDSNVVSGYVIPLMNAYNEYLKLLGKKGEEFNSIGMPFNDVIYRIAASMLKDSKIISAFLEINSIVDRYYSLYEFIINHINILKIKSEIEEKVRDRVNKNQKEYYLREQLRVITQELGDEEPVNEYLIYQEKLKALDIDAEIKEKIAAEIKKYKSYVAMSQEGAIQKNYLDTVFNYPWNIYDTERTDIEVTKKILNNDHYGLNQVKERILEFIALRTFNPTGNIQILCLAGPPGTGKTSIAISIAKSLNRKLQRISLGGVRDESEIRGHRRTYIGAMPGRIVKAMIQAGTSNPVILLDEIDKVGSSFKGDPASALLEVLDYEQNVSFRDNYFELPVDLSKVLFITTANSLSTIPLPLLDRMDIIEVNSYTANEKFHIAKDYLYPKQLYKSGLKSGKVKITDGVLKEVIKSYVKEAGVRRLERKIAEILRKGAKYLLENKKNSITITKKNLKDFLGNPKFVAEEANKIDSPGIVNGLAWTSVGGCVLQIEINTMPGKGRMELTGQMGDVMKESAIIARTYIKSIASKYGVKEDYFETNDIHIHIPEGAVPKDGPSAGITMASAMISSILNKPAKADLCMTGEVTLRGRVLAIGGLKEKLLAAKMASISTVIVPLANKKDVEEIDKEITAGMEIHYVTNMDSVIDLLFRD